jgi:para-nitrobenzyl esterase
MVWLHGSGLLNGRTNDYDPRKLLMDGDLVVVSTTYRINVLGYMAHPALDAEGHPFGNCGTLDQQAALKWVQQNIKTFGGDPNNVTVFGESTGGIAIMFNLVSPGAAGLFQKVILESGVSASAQTPLETAKKTGSDFATAMGCEDQTALCMRSKSADEIIAMPALASLNSRFYDKLHPPHEMRSVFNCQRREQNGLQLRYTRNQLQQRMLSERSQRYLG